MSSLVRSRWTRSSILTIAVLFQAVLYSQHSAQSSLTNTETAELSVIEISKQTHGPTETNDVNKTIGTKASNDKTKKPSKDQKKSSNTECENTRSKTEQKPSKTRSQLPNQKKRSRPSVSSDERDSPATSRTTDRSYSERRSPVKDRNTRIKSSSGRLRSSKMRSSFSDSEDTSHSLDRKYKSRYRSRSPKYRHNSRHHRSMSDERREKLCKRRTRSRERRDNSHDQRSRSSDSRERWTSRRSLSLENGGKYGRRRGGSCDHREKSYDRKGRSANHRSSMPSPSPEHRIESCTRRTKNYGKRSRSRSPRRRSHSPRSPQRKTRSRHLDTVEKSKSRSPHGRASVPKRRRRSPHESNSSPSGSHSSNGRLVKQPLSPWSYQAITMQVDNKWKVYCAMYDNYKLRKTNSNKVLHAQLEYLKIYKQFFTEDPRFENVYTSLMDPQELRILLKTRMERGSPGPNRSATVTLDKSSSHISAASRQSAQSRPRSCSPDPEQVRSWRKNLLTETSQTSDETVSERENLRLWRRSIVSSPSRTTEPEDSLLAHAWKMNYKYDPSPVGFPGLKDPVPAPPTVGKTLLDEVFSHKRTVVPPSKGPPFKPAKTDKLMPLPQTIDYDLLLRVAPILGGLATDESQDESKSKSRNPLRTWCSSSVSLDTVSTYLPQMPCSEKRLPSDIYERTGVPTGTFSANSHSALSQSSFAKISPDHPIANPSEREPPSWNRLQPGAPSHNKSDIQPENAVQSIGPNQVCLH